MQTEILSNKAAYEVAIGQKVAEVLNLKMDKKTGRINTDWGNKTIQGIGATVLRIVEDENKRFEEQAQIDEVNENFEMGLLTKLEYEQQINKIVTHAK